MHDIAPARLATDGDVWTSDGIVLPWQPPTATDEVILVSVTGSDAALEEFPSELEAFPSEQDEFSPESEAFPSEREERLHAPPANRVEFPFEDSKLEDLFAAESTPTLATDLTPAVAVEPTSTDVFAVEPTPAIAVVVPAIARAATPDQPKVSSLAVRTARPRERVVLVDTPIATHARTPSTFSARHARSNRRVIGAGAAAALLVATVATAVTVGWPRTSLFYSDAGTARPEPPAPLPAFALRTPTAYPAVPPSPEDDGLLSGALTSNEESNEETLSAVSAASPPQQEPSRAAVAPGATDQPAAQVRSEPSLSATASVASSRAAVPPTAYVRPAEPIVSAPHFVAAEPIVPTVLSSRPPVADAVATSTATESTPPITVASPVTVAVAPIALADDTATTSRVAESAVQDVLGRYKAAYSSLNAGAAASVWPTVDAKALGKAFERLETQEIEFDRCDVVVTGARAVATCGGRARYVPKVGNKSAHVESRQWRFDLRKLNDRWLIDAVSAR